MHWSYRGQFTKYKNKSYHASLSIRSNCELHIIYTNFVSQKKYSYGLRNYNLCFTRTTYTNVFSIFIKIKWYLFVIRSHKNYSTDLTEIIKLMSHFSSWDRLRVIIAGHFNKSSVVSKSWISWGVFSVFFKTKSTNINFERGKNALTWAIHWMKEIWWTKKGKLNYREQCLLP